jgi:ADP-ribose pyrophosphatase YjhB (NUDIX family)
MSFRDSYLGKLRAIVGSRLLQAPGARAVLENNRGEILLQLRADFKVWGLPAGCPEEGEDIRATIKREVFEETGLKIEDIIPFAFGSSPEGEFLQYPNGDKIHSYALCFYTKTWTGDLLSSNDETLQLKFFPIDQLPEMLPNHAKTIKSYLVFKGIGKVPIFIGR